MELPRIPTEFPMRLRQPHHALLALATFLRERLEDVGRWARPAELESVDTVVIAAAAPFASTSYARARLLRQMHATGLLTAGEAEQAGRLIGVAP